MAILRPPKKAWTDISTEYVPPDEGEQPARIVEVTSGKTKKNNLEQLTIKCEIDNPGHDDHGKPVFDFIVLETNKGGDNDVGYGKVKQYVEAILGEEVANDPEFELDTDDFLNGEVVIQIKHRSYTPEGETDARTNAEIKRVFPRG